MTRPMVYKKDKWTAALNKAIADLGKGKPAGAVKPASGMPTAIASLRYTRDELLDDLFGSTPEELAKMTDEDKAFALSIRESFKELINAISKEGVHDGFASNASAAAKAAGFKVIAGGDLNELTD